jgi:hypothetical protein
MNQENYMSPSDSTTKPTEPKDSESNGKVLGGLVLLVVGGVWLARQFGAELPEWLFTWQMIIIAVGIFVGARSRFRDWSWLITVTVGVLLLLKDFVEGVSFQNLWPIIVIVVGLSMILNSTQKGKKGCA